MYWLLYLFYLQDNSTEDTCILDDDDDEDVAPIVSTKQPTKQGRKPSKRQKTEAAETELLHQAIRCMEKSSASNPEPVKADGLDLFGQYVTSELQAISNPQAQRWAKLQIQTILYESQLEPSTPFQPISHIGGPFQRHIGGPTPYYMGSSTGSSNSSLTEQSSHHSLSDSY